MTIAAFRDFKQKRFLLFVIFFRVSLAISNGRYEKGLMDKKIAEFANTHKTAHQAGLKGLFRFLSFSLEEDAVSRHKKTLSEGWLYHTTRERLNDPHDLNFRLDWPSLDDEDGIEGFVEDLKIGIAMSGIKEFPIRLAIGDLLKDEQYRNRFESQLRAQYEKTRVCCFTTSHLNPLFWAHYAKSGTGYCMRFKVGEGNKSIFSNTRKILYSDNYPVLKFPIISTNIISTMRPILSKSSEWIYENEFRSFFSPDWPHQLENNGDSLSLINDEITDIYFGLNMGEAEKAKIIELTEDGPFNPCFWNAVTDRHSFKLKFERY